MFNGLVKVFSLFLYIKTGRESLKHAYPVLQFARLRARTRVQLPSIFSDLGFEVAVARVKVRSVHF